jgi:spore germination protein KA
MVSLRSAGVPYMTPLAPGMMNNWKTVIFRMPFWSTQRRPDYIQKNNIIKAKKPQ